MKTLDIIKDIIDKEMEMPSNRVWAYNSSVDLPKDSGLFIVLRMTYRNPYANNRKEKHTSTGLQSHQTMLVAEDIIISLLSKNTEARDRAQDVQLALNSFYAEQLQEKYHLHIARLGEVYDASFLEATTRMNRFDVKCKVIRSYDKIKDIDYYDKFSFEVWTEKTNNEVQKTIFNIPETNEQGK